ncbi:hypothetical protein V5T82_15335 [Magnetovibrio sp. PR-2]|uniref:hypothetical protein n=1 Tax=Magnetovibrio sp. PR-2 TaxID=3120356 RepID=UPI002FCE4C6B
MAKMNLDAFDHPVEPEVTEPTVAEQKNVEKVEQEQVADIIPDETTAAAPQQLPAKQMHKTSLYIPMGQYKTLEMRASQQSYTVDDQGSCRGKVRANDLVLEAVERYLREAETL